MAALAFRRRLRAMINVSPGIALLRAAVALAFALYFLRCARLLALVAAAVGVALWASA